MPEMLVCRHLHALGSCYRLPSPKLPRHPDIVPPNGTRSFSSTDVFGIDTKVARRPSYPSQTWSSGRPSSTAMLHECGRRRHASPPLAGCRLHTCLSWSLVDQANQFKSLCLHFGNHLKVQQREVVVTLFAVDR